MFQKGDRVHLHDGSVITVRRKGHIPRRPKGHELVPIRGFVRGQIIDPNTNEVLQDTEWHENVITTYGHGIIIRNFVASSAGSGAAIYWAIGRHTSDASGAFTGVVTMQSEYGLSQGTSTGGGRANLSAAPGTQVIAGTWTLSQSYGYANSVIVDGAVLNAIGNAINANRNGGSLVSIATFQEVTKYASAALNLTYNWVFSTGV